MIKSIQQFEEVGVKKLGKVLENFVKTPEKQAEFVYGVTDAVVRLGLDIIKKRLKVWMKSSGQVAFASQTG